ncbi:MAG: sulfite exporter TauE/SafE family protein [Balneolaceae bacterium]|nr:sulfite exporter TauE/SafE family protein [Balneolaceae bacterium]
MIEAFFTEPWWIYLTVFVVGMASYIISVISGGGGSLLLIPVINFMFGPKIVAPVINLGDVIGRPSRLAIFWKHIRWDVVRWYAPAAVVGVLLAGWLFTRVEASWVQIIIGVFLVSTVFQYGFGKKKRTFKMKKWYWPFLGVGVATISTIVGGLGPVLNPFYLNAGILKEEMIATKTANSFFMGAVQIGTYTFLGALYGDLWVLGIILGLGATAGNLIGKRLLSSMTDVTFRKYVLGVMVISGLYMILSKTGVF